MFSDAGYNITYLQDTINLAHWLLKRGYYKTWRKGSRFEKSVWVTGGLSLVPYLDSSRFLAQFTARLSYHTIIPRLSTLIQKSGYGAPDIIWTTVPGSTALKDIFPRAKLFFHVIDRYSAYRGDGVSVLEANDYRRADHIFVIGQALKIYLQEKFGVEPARITNLGQGVALEKYQGAFSAPEEFYELPHPIAIWVGLIKKLDFGLLRAAVDGIKNLGGAVVLIGPDFERVKKEFKNESSLLCLGSRSGDDVPAYLQASDIGLMLYDRQKREVYEGQHPLKLYEYAAAGLPIVSTYHKEFDFINPPLITVASDEEVGHAILKAATASEQFRTQVLAFAQTHSWEACLKRAENVFAQMGI